jgi:hypothetical protein
LMKTVYPGNSSDTRVGCSLGMRIDE